MNKQYRYFSAKAKEQPGSVIWKFITGEEIGVSESNSLWEDTIEVSIIVNYVRWCLLCNSTRVIY